MAIKVPGSLAGLQYVTETTPGTTPATAFSYGGHMRTMSMVHDPHPEELEPDNSRTFSDMIFTGEDFGFSTELSIFRDQSPYKWPDLLNLALGSLTAPADDLPSFSALLQVAKDQFFLAKGCKVNSLELSTEGVGKQIRATIDVMSMLIPKPQSTRAGLGTLGAAATKPTTAPLTYTAYPTCSGLSGITTIPASSWKLSIGNSLVRKEGIIGTQALTAGSGLVPGEVDLRLSLDVMSSSLFWDNLKLSLTSGFSVTLPIYGYKVNLTGCYLPSNDLPSRSQSDYDETIDIIAKSISIVAA